MTPTAIITVPLKPSVLRDAGVPLEDALWLAKHNSVRARQRALRTDKGESILGRVERFVQNCVLAPDAKVLATA